MINEITKPNDKLAQGRCNRMNSKGRHTSTDISTPDMRSGLLLRRGMTILQALLCPWHTILSDGCHKLVTAPCHNEML